MEKQQIHPKLNYMKIQKSSILVFILVVFFWACSNDEVISDDDRDSSAQENCDSELKYADIKPIITNNCSGSSCHGENGTQINLMGFENLKTIIENGQLDNRALGDNANMPPSGWSSEADKEKVKCWVDNEYPEN